MAPPTARLTRVKLGAREILGVPRLPPSRLSQSVARARAGVGRLHAVMAPPPLAILEGLFGLLDHGGLVSLCELGVPDVLDAPCSIDDLARRLAVDEGQLERVIRYAAARHWLRLDRRGRVRPTSVTRFLRRDHPGGWRAWVDFAGASDVTAAVAALGAGIRRGDEPYALANGQRFFDRMRDDPARGSTFDAAMSAGGRMHGLALAAAIDWSAARRVCDVGGGDGSLLRVLLAEQAHLAGVLLDVPAVVARAVPADRLTTVAGDAFLGVPADCDTYLFVNVIHDWHDDDAVRLLARAAADAPSGARIVVVEAERRLRPIDDVALRTDLLMLALAPGGRERTTNELQALAGRAGLRRTRSVRLATNDIAHVLTR